jgi:hypothetical protein
MLAKYPWSSLPRLVPLLFALWGLFGGQAHAQSLGLHGGVNLDRGSLHVGGDLLFRVATLSPSVRLDVWPSYGHVFVPHGHDVELLGVDFPFEFAIKDAVVTPFAAPGLGLAFYGDTSLKLNLIGGLFFETHSPVRPFVELAIRLVNGTFVDLLGGVLFEL